MEFADPALPTVPGETKMANISHEAVLSAAWMLMRSAREANSLSHENETSNPDSWNTQHSGSDESPAKETVKNLISTYLRPATHISSHFHCW
jgi:hypothetical protein